jgi:hypothetical protein
MHRASRWRRLVLIVAVGCLMLYGGLQSHFGKAEASLVELAPRVQERSEANPASGPTPAALAPPVRNIIDQQPKNDLFLSTSWLPPAPPPPPPPKLAPPPPPQAPPVPYRFVGLLEDSVRPTAFLSRGDTLLLVSTGDTVEGIYRVDQITQKDIALTYLPLNERQLIRIPGEL